MGLGRGLVYTSISGAPCVDGSGGQEDTQGCPGRACLGQTEGKRGTTSLAPLLGCNHVPLPRALDAPASPSEHPQDPGLPSPYPHLDGHLPALETSFAPWL